MKKIPVVDAAADNTAGDVTITIADGYTDTALAFDGPALDLNAIDLTVMVRNFTVTSSGH